MRIVRWHRLAPVAIGLAAVVATGCGGSDAAHAARDVVTRFQQAVQARDGTTACALLDAAARRAVADQEQAPCARAILRTDLPQAPVTGAEAAITNAKVDLAGGTSAFLGQTGAGWRISAIGCRPAGGKPQDRPFDCAVDA